VSAPLEGRPTLVTGGAGFVGSHLVEALVERGARVTVVDDLSTGSEANLEAVAGQVELQELDIARDDLRPLLSSKGVEAVFHVAGNAYVPTSVEDPRDDFTRNVVGTYNLLEAVRDATPAARLVHTSSAAVYGETAGGVSREEDATLPVAPYGVSKLAAERYVAVYASVFGLWTANLRLFPVYGPRLRKQVVYDLMRKVLDNPDELFIYGDGSQVRDFNHVGNVVDSILLVLEAGRGEGEVYNVAADEPVAIRDLAAMICERLGVSPTFVYSGDVRAGEVQSWVGDHSRLAALGYSPRIGLSEGLADTVAWFRQEELVGRTVESQAFG
jgi:UDP-glucose 4-epimerase